MLLRLAYLAVTSGLAALRLLPMSDRAKDVEVLVLRRQITVLERQLRGAKVRFARPTGPSSLPSCTGFPAVCWWRRSAASATATAASTTTDSDYYCTAESNGPNRLPPRIRRRRPRFVA